MTDVNGWNNHGDRFRPLRIRVIPLSNWAFHSFLLVVTNYLLTGMILQEPIPQALGA